MKKLKDANENGAMSADAVAVDPILENKKKDRTKIFKIRIVIPREGGDARLSVIKIAATGRRDARELAQRIVFRLPEEQVEAIGVDAYDICEEAFEVQVFDLYAGRDNIPGHVWTRHEIEGENLDDVVAKATEEIAALVD